MAAGSSKTARRSAAPIALGRIPFGEGVLSRQPEGSSAGSKSDEQAAVRMRERCKAMLQIHMQHSSPKQAASIGYPDERPAAATKQWAMQCSRRAELHLVVGELLEALKGDSKKVSDTLYFTRLQELVTIEYSPSDILKLLKHVCVGTLST